MVNCPILLIKSSCYLNFDIYETDISIYLTFCLRQPDHIASNAPSTNLRCSTDFSMNMCIKNDIDSPRLLRSGVQWRQRSINFYSFINNNNNKKSRKHLLTNPHETFIMNFCFLNYPFILVPLAGVVGTPSNATIMQCLNGSRGAANG